MTGGGGDNARVRSYLCVFEVETLKLDFLRTVVTRLCLDIFLTPSPPPSLGEYPREVLILAYTEPHKVLHRRKEIDSSWYHVCVLWVLVACFFEYYRSLEGSFGGSCKV